MDLHLPVYNYVKKMKVLFLNNVKNLFQTPYFYSQPIVL